MGDAVDMVGNDVVQAAISASAIAKANEAEAEATAEIANAQSIAAVEATVKSKEWKRPEQRQRLGDRELHALIGGRPSAVPKQGGGYKIKTAVGNKVISHWEYVDFTNPARSDGLVLSHWCKSVNKNKPYAFSRFNKVLNIPTFTDEEYSSLFEDNNNNNNNGWTKEDTELLFELCRCYDQRFIVVHDKFPSERVGKDGKVRSIEDLKDRFYDCCHKIMTARQGIGTTTAEAGQDTNPNLASMLFDAGHERRRKEQLEKLLRRSAMDITEEAQLVHELKAIEARNKISVKERQTVQRLLSLSDESFYSYRRVRRKQDPSGRRIGESGEDEIENRRSGSNDQIPGVMPGPYLRSLQTLYPPSFSDSMARKLDVLLEEMGVSLRPLPTTAVVTTFDEVRNKLHVILDFKRHAERREREVAVLQTQYDKMLEQLQEARASKIAFLKEQQKIEATKEVEEHKSTSTTAKEVSELVSSTISLDASAAIPAPHPNPTPGSSIIPTEQIRQAAAVAAAMSEVESRTTIHDLADLPKDPVSVAPSASAARVAAAIQADDEISIGGRSSRRNTAENSPTAAGPVLKRSRRN